MTERYGNVKVTKIRAAYNDLRAAVRAGDMDAVSNALDRYEPWADYIFDERHKIERERISSYVDMIRAREPKRVEITEVQDGVRHYTGEFK